MAKTLSEWLADAGMSYSEAARRTGASGARTIERHAKGSRYPSATMRKAYRELTGGEVTAESFDQPTAAE